MGSEMCIRDSTYPGMTPRPLSLNRYAFVEGRPTSWIDPLGLTHQDSDKSYVDLIEIIDNSLNFLEIIGIEDPYGLTKSFSVVFLGLKIFEGDFDGAIKDYVQTKYLATYVAAVRGLQPVPPGPLLVVIPSMTNQLFLWAGRPPMVDAGGY